MKAYYCLKILNENGETEYTLTEMDGNKYWLSNKHQESMGISADKLYELFDKYFKEKF